MTKEEILEYIFLCISYKHNNDISPYITKSACEKENLLFENAIEFLDKLEKENAELKEVHESDKRSLALIAKKGADFEKAYNEAEELLDKQIEATYKLLEENKELKKKIENLQKYLDTQNRYRECAETWVKLTKAKELIETMLIFQEGISNMGDLKQQARDFIKGINND